VSDLRFWRDGFAGREPPLLQHKRIRDMSIIAWLVLGLIAGFIASKIVNNTGQGIVLDIVLGVVGAVVGGWLFTSLGSTGVTGFNIYSIIVSVIGAVVVLVVYHLVFGRRAV
jgi:uncharacterized membrane protein YeaQ/YmgE (transglycosylase-associated protein family)